jgi:hypothetical protein
VVQEVVVNPVVVFQRGPHQLDSDCLHTLLEEASFEDNLARHYAVDRASFTRTVRLLRHGKRAVSRGTDMNTLFGLAYHFRHQSATVGVDRVYAFMELLPSGDPSLLIPSYDKSAEEVFMLFTVSSMKHDKNLTVLAVATGVSLPNVSWCRDWRLGGDGKSEALLSFSASPPPSTRYSASGTQSPILTLNIFTRTLSIRGYTVDTIASVSTFFRTVRKPADLIEIFDDWERLAKNHGLETTQIERAINRLLVADWPGLEKTRWKEMLGGLSQRSPTHGELERYMTVLHNVVLHRSFYVTKNGRLGLGRWNVQRAIRYACCWVARRPLFCDG